MNNIVDISMSDSSSPRRDNMAIIEQVALNYKLNLKYGGIFRLARNLSKMRCHDEVTNEPDGENGSDSDCPNENSYHNLHSSDDECDMKNSEFEVHSDMKNSPTMKVHKRFPNVIIFRRALNHYALINEFGYKIEKSDLKRLTTCCETNCKWRIHASTMDDDITFQVKKFVETHSCTRSKKCGNKRATQGWIANVVSDKIKSDGDISTTEIMKWLITSYNVDVPYMRAYKEACSRGFLAGFRPYISLDACHLIGKFNGVLAAAISIDGNNESFNSWVGDARFRPVLDLLDSIREMLMNLGEYQVSRSSDNHAEVKYKGKRWEVLLDERRCSCRVWQVKAYALEISPIPDKDQWAPIDTSEKIYPPIIKHPVGHLQKTCKKSPCDASSSQASKPCQPPPCKRRRVKNTKACESNKSKPN
ncbi:transposase, MuDR [Artemisia annua]|uniref:Transposase, MuDR n=1 Tax=Artemisia annua TaxID=35608 RepID=A0A2U1MKN3_ARTAN|nr:transposase, MuDR [Artemisia annua]